jgi:hypothetical protein
VLVTDPPAEPHQNGHSALVGVVERLRTWWPSNTRDHVQSYCPECGRTSRERGVPRQAMTPAGTGSWSASALGWARLLDAPKIVKVS